MASRKYTPEQRVEAFWNKVDINPDIDACWLWSGARHGQGYGLVRWNGPITFAHRVAWEIANRRPPGDLDVLHSCDNPPCCNPNHLFLGTHTDNMRDMKQKGRAHRATGEKHGSKTHPERLRRGENHPSKLRPETILRGEEHWSRTNPDQIVHGESHGMHKLTESEVLELRERHALGGVSYRQLAREKGVHKSTIRNAILGKTWKRSQG